MLEYPAAACMSFINRMANRTQTVAQTGDARPAAPARPRPAPAARKGLVVVRGRAWYNMSEAERPRPGEQQPPASPSVQSLVQTLRRGCSHEERILAAVALSEWGPDARAA